MFKFLMTTYEICQLFLKFSRIFENTLAIIADYFVKYAVCINARFAPLTS